MLKANDIKFTLASARAYSGMKNKDIVKKMKHTVTWLSLIEHGKRNISGQELIDLFILYGLGDISINQIFLPKKSTKRISKNKKGIRKIIKK